MRKTLKSTVIMVVCAMLLGLLLPGCGSGNKDESVNLAATENTAKAAATDDIKDSASKNNINMDVKKKVVIVKEINDDSRKQQEDKIKLELQKAGFIDGKNVEITVIEMNSDETKSEETVKRVKEIKPDVAVIISSTFSYQTVVKALEGTEIPIIITANMENKTLDFIDENGMPKKNITGLKTMPDDLQKNAFEWLNKISPIDGKKAVFVTVKILCLLTM